MQQLLTQSDSTFTDNIISSSLDTWSKRQLKRTDSTHHVLRIWLWMSFQAPGTDQYKNFSSQAEDLPGHIWRIVALLACYETSLKGMRRRTGINSLGLMLALCNSNTCIQSAL